MASGDTLIILTPFNYESPSSGGAAMDMYNLHPVLGFDAADNDEGIFTSLMPRHYGGGGLTIYLHYAMNSATSGDVDWDVAFERIGDQQQDINSDGFAAVNSVDNTTVPATNGLVDIVNITFTDGADMDSIAVGESFRIKIIRDGASDTAAGDAGLIAIEIKET